MQLKNSCQTHPWRGLIFPEWSPWQSVYELSAGPICQGLKGVRMGGLSGTLELWVVCCSILGELKAPVCWLAATHQERGELHLPWCFPPPSRASEICSALLTEHSFPQTSRGTDSASRQKGGRRTGALLLGMCFIPCRLLILIGFQDGRPPPWNVT